MVVTKHLSIHGLVQGVGFRVSLAAEARRRRLAGWVRNRRDGTVEAVVAGAPDQVEALIAWARRGPPAAQVTGIDVDTDPQVVDSFAVDGNPPGFEQRQTV